MNEHFLAGVLYAAAAWALLGMLAIAARAARVRSPVLAVVAVVLGLAVAALIANGAADLWAAAG